MNWWRVRAGVELAEGGKWDGIYYNSKQGGGEVKRETCNNGTWPERKRELASERGREEGRVCQQREGVN